MRTTVQLDPDTGRAVEELRRDGRGVSEAVNELIRRGLSAQPERPRFVGRTHKMGLRIDVTSVGTALELLDEVDARPDR